MRNLSKQDLFDLLKEWMVNSLNGRLYLDYNDIEPSSTLYDLGFDSLDVVELTITIENRLKIEIKEEDVDAVLYRKTMEEVVDLIHAIIINQKKNEHVQ